MTEVVVQTSVVQAVVEDSDVQVVVTGNQAGTVEVIAEGPQGPQGDLGPPGPQGPQGEPGPPGAATIGGYDVSISSVQTGDLLAFDNSQWVNQSPSAVTDGGNF